MKFVRKTLTAAAVAGVFATAPIVLPTGIAYADDVQVDASAPATVPVEDAGLDAPAPEAAPPADDAEFEPAPPADAAPAAESGGATTTAGAVEQPSPASRAGATVAIVAAGAEGGPGSLGGYRPGVVGEMVPAGTGFLPVGSGRTRGGRVLSSQGAATGTADAGRYAGAERARRRVAPVSEVSQALPPAGAGAMSREAGRHPVRRAAQRPLPRGDGHPLDGHRADLGTAPAGVPGPESAGHPVYGHHSAGLPGGMMPPMMGGAGTTDSEQQHQAPDYLLDDVDLFDGNSWVTPPVIGR